MYVRIVYLFAHMYVPGLGFGYFHLAKYFKQPLPSFKRWKMLKKDQQLS